jgi:hypothetical protein
MASVYDFVVSLPLNVTVHRIVCCAATAVNDSCPNCEEGMWNSVNCKSDEDTLFTVEGRSDI